MKWLINIRGAVASGKTTCVRQFCQLKGFTVEKIPVCGAEAGISVIGDGKVIVLGDYSNPANCVGTDRWKDGKGSGAGKDMIAAAVIKVANELNPDIIIYEHMLTSQIYRSTKIIADAGWSVGYQYKGIQLYRPEESRLQMLIKRSGAMARTKNFGVNAKRVNRATEMLMEHGYDCKVVRVDTIPEQDMWKIIDDEIRKTV